MLTSANIFFGIAFLGQIFVISYYFPKKILARMDYVRATYPPTQYPRLYPKPADYYVIGRSAFKFATRVILALGILILFVVLFVVDHATFADDGFISEAFPAAYGMIQFLPLMALEISEFSQFKLMRKAHVTTTRTAELSRRLDFVREENQSASGGRRFIRPGFSRRHDNEPLFSTPRISVFGSQPSKYAARGH